MTILADKEKRRSLRKSLYEKLEAEGVLIPLAIKDLRRIMGLTQGDFAKRIGISLSALRRIEQGHDNFTFDTLNKVLKPFSLQVVVKKSDAIK